MNTEDIESTLDALRKLYALLGTDGDIAPDFMSNLLDDKSRLLLKHLLDMETKKVFKSHKEVLVPTQDSGLSGTEYSIQSLQLSDGSKQQPLALQDQSETSPVIQNSGNDLDKFGYEYAKTENQENLPIHPMLGNGSRNKSCRNCKRRIVDPKAGSEIIGLHPLNDHIDNVPESLRTLGKEKQKGLVDGLDITATGSMPFSLYSSATSSTKATEECHVESLPEEVSDVIKQIESCIQNLKIQFGSRGLHTSTSCPMDNVAKRASVATGTSQIGYSDAKSEESFYQMVNEERKDSSPQCQVLSKTISQGMKTKWPNEDNVQLLECLQLRNSIMRPESHISSQGEDTSFFGQSVKSIVAKLESLNQMRQNGTMSSETYNFKSLPPNSFEITERVPVLNRDTQNDPVLKEIYNINDLLPNRNMNSLMVPTSVTWLPNQIDEENLHEKRSAIDAISKTTVACQPSGPSKVPCDYLFSGTNIHIDDISSKSNLHQTWKAQRKEEMPYQVFEGHTPQSTRNSKGMDEEQLTGNPKNKDSMHRLKKISHHKHKYVNTYLNSSSSSWGSQQGSSSSCENDETYIPRRKHRQKYASPSSTSNSRVYSLWCRRQRHYTDTSSSMDEYSTTTGDKDRGYEITSSSCNESMDSGEYSSSTTSATTGRYSSIGDSSESKEYSLQPRFQHYKKQPRYIERNMTSKEKTGSPRFSKKHEVINPKKQVGTWKKLKDKLSIIFHHHHHHHHHHHRRHRRLDPDEEGRDASNDEAQIINRPGWKTSPSVRFEEAYGKQGKPYKSSVVLHRNKGHHFNKLVGGLFSHIKNSKKSEVSAKRMKHLVGKSGEHKGKKALRKQHWWQMLQRRRKLKKKPGLGFQDISKKRFSRIYS